MTNLTKDPARDIMNTLETLQSELKKIEDLNGLANKYRDVAASMILALDSLLKDEKEYRKDNEVFLSSANLAIQSVKKDLEDAIHALNLMDSEVSSQSDSLKHLMERLQGIIAGSQEACEGRINEAKVRIIESEKIILGSYYTKISSDFESKAVDITKLINIANEAILLIKNQNDTFSSHAKNSLGEINRSLSSLTEDLNSRMDAVFKSIDKLSGLIRTQSESIESFRNLFTESMSSLDQKNSKTSDLIIRSTKQVKARIVWVGVIVILINIAIIVADRIIVF